MSDSASKIKLRFVCESKLTFGSINETKHNFMILI